MGICEPITLENYESKKLMLRIFAVIPALLTLVITLSLLWTGVQLWPMLIVIGIIVVGSIFIVRGAITVKPSDIMVQITTDFIMVAWCLGFGIYLFIYAVWPKSNNIFAGKISNRTTVVTVTAAYSALFFVCAGITGFCAVIAIKQYLFVSRNRYELTTREDPNRPRRGPADVPLRALRAQSPSTDLVPDFASVSNSDV